MARFWLVSDSLPTRLPTRFSAEHARDTLAESRRLFEVEMGEKRTMLEEELNKRAEQMVQDISVREANLKASLEFHILSKHP